MATDISRKQIENLVREVLEVAPGVESTGAQADQLIAETIENAGAIIQGIEALIKEDGVGASVVVALMVQGACATVLDGLPPDNVRSQAYRAGRRVGKFLSDRWAEGIRSKLIEEKH